MAGLNDFGQVHRLRPNVSGKKPDFLSLGQSMFKCFIL